MVFSWSFAVLKSIEIFPYFRLCYWVVKRFRFSNTGWYFWCVNIFELVFKWFATVFRISFGFVISLPSLSSTLGFSNFSRLRALTAEKITSSVCALLIASACLFSSLFLKCVTFFLIWCSTSFFSFFQLYLLIRFLCVVYLDSKFFLALGQV